MSLQFARQERFDLRRERFEGERYMTEPLEPYYTTDYGMLFGGDCLDYLPEIRNEVIDTFFADPRLIWEKSTGRAPTTTAPTMNI